MPKTILIMAGGTGGHIYPALAIADKLKSDGWNIQWLGTKLGLEKRIVPEAGYPIHWVDVKGVRGKGLWQKLVAPLNILSAAKQSFNIIKSTNPNVVLGMGGFVSVPGGLMSFVCKKPLVIHEQNAVCGTANSLLQYVASRVIFAFTNAFKEGGKYKLLGNPVRSQIQKSTGSNYDNEKLNIAVLGGSLGASSLNRVLPEALAKLKHKCEVVHQCGKKNIQEVVDSYEQHEIDADVRDYVDDMNKLYQWADLAVCRSGTKNAKFLEDVGAAKIISDEDLNSDNLAALIASLSEKQVLENMKKKLLSVAKPNAIEDIANECKEVAK